MRKGDQARRELTARATALFDERGYDAVSMRDIAEALDWPKSLIYYYCSGKAQLAQLAARTRAEATLRELGARLADCPPGSVARLERALSCAGFWRGDAPSAARELRARYTPGNAAWRACLRDALAPGLGDMCNDIIARGVKSYELYTPFPEQMGRVAVGLAGDLADALAQLICAAPTESELLARADALLRAHRCALERLVEAPFGALRLVELEYLRDTARAYELER